MSIALRSNPYPKDRFIPFREEVDQDQFRIPDLAIPPTTSYDLGLRRALNLRNIQVVNITGSKEPKLKEVWKSRWQLPNHPNQTFSLGVARDDYYTNNIDYGTKACAINDQNRTYILPNSGRSDFLDALGKPLDTIKWRPSGDYLGLGNDDQFWITNIDTIQQIYRCNFTDKPADPQLSKFFFRCMEWISDNAVALGAYGTISIRDLRTNSWLRWPMRRDDNGHIIRNAPISAITWNRVNEHLGAFGRDNGSVEIFDMRNIQIPVVQYSHFDSYVKALSWVPKSSCLLLSGGGDRDRKLKLYNCNQGRLITEQETGSQISSLQPLDKDYFLTSYGYNSDSKLQLWRYDRIQSQFQALAKSAPNDYRILSLTKDPNSSIVCSLSADCLSYWPLKSTEHTKKNKFLGAGIR